MESKIIIDIDGDGQPRIRIDYKLTEDLRDRLVGRFLGKMGIAHKRTGFWGYFRLAHETKEGACVMIEPMDEHILDLHFPEIERIVKSQIPDQPNPRVLSVPYMDTVHDLLLQMTVHLGQGNLNKVAELLTEAKKAAHGENS